MDLWLRTEAAQGATVGQLLVGDRTFYTIELPWLDNETDESCVPAGTYSLIPYLSPTHGQTWRLHNPTLGVWGQSDIPPTVMRTEIELHAMNFARESEGCIGVGLTGDDMLDSETGQIEPAVQNSVAAIAQLRQLLLPEGLDNTLTSSEPLQGAKSPMFTALLALLKAEVPTMIALFVTSVVVPFTEQIGFPLSTLQQEKIESWINLGIVLLVVGITKLIHTHVQFKRAAQVLPAPVPPKASPPPAWTKPTK